MRLGLLKGINFFFSPHFWPIITPLHFIHSFQTSKESSREKAVASQRGVLSGRIIHTCPGQVHSRTGNERTIPVGSERVEVWSKGGLGSQREGSQERVGCRTSSV